MGVYSNERNIQILIGVLKANNIKKVVISPGTTNVSFVASLVNDGSFELYSAVDERGAAYIACGLASESGEPVVITCTGATASRNYFPGMTEAYHRKLPILAVTASQTFKNRGNLSPQYIDRTEHPTDSMRISVQVPVIFSSADEYNATIEINRAVLELFRHGGGPAHINLASSYCNDFDVNDLKDIRVFHRYFYEDKLPEIENGKKIAIAVGNHKQFTPELTNAVDDFCGKYDAVVIVDHSSHYWGKYRVLPTILTAQEKHNTKLFDIDLLIHIGEEHGDYFTATPLNRAKEVWRVSPDGEIRDTFRKLTNIFEMSEKTFFTYYSDTQCGNTRKNAYLQVFRKEVEGMYQLVPELPFSNIYLAQQIIPRFPSGAAIELGVSNTMRAWTFFDFAKETYTLANTGCRGIDGAIPTLLGMSLTDKNRLHFAVMGDLTFFYSFNVLANRNVGNNLRILLVNNGCGTEFNIYINRAYKLYKGNHEKINEYVGAGGHNGRKSKQLVKHYAEDLGFEYMSALDKDEFLNNIDRFLTAKLTDKPMIFEVFTDEEGESEALRIICNLVVDKHSTTTKAKIAKILPKGVKSALKKIIGK